MAVAVATHRPRHAAPGHGHRLLLAGVIGAMALLLAVLSRVPESRDGADVATPPRAEDAVGGWLVAHRGELFPGYAGPYVGRCPTDTEGVVDGLCSNLSEDLGDLQIHIVGVYASDWGADLLLQRTDGGWAVIDSSPWPALGTPGEFGAPWSPQTAINAWWSTRAEARYGAGAVHVGSCAEAGDVATGQPVLCSTLVDHRDGTRTYTSGLVGEAPDVRLVLTEATDHTWSVERSREL